MLGMMNCNNDAVEFYAAPTRGPACESDKVFVEHKEKQKVSYTEDGRKMIDGKIVENEEQTQTLTPQQRWNRLILVTAAAGGIKKTSGSGKDNCF